MKAAMARVAAARDGQRWLGAAPGFVGGFWFDWDYVLAGNLFRSRAEPD